MANRTVELVNLCSPSIIFIKPIYLMSILLYLITYQNDEDLRQFEILKSEVNSLEKELSTDMKTDFADLKAKLSSETLIATDIDAAKKKFHTSNETATSQKEDELNFFKTQIDEKIEKLKEEKKKKIEEHQTWISESLTQLSAFDRCVEYLNMQVSDAPVKEKLHREFDEFIGEKKKNEH